MPFRLHIPLPGPFSYSARIGGGARRAGDHGALWILCVGIWWFPLKWLVLGSWWLLVVSVRLCVLLWKLAVR